MQHSDNNRKFEGGQAHHLFRDAARMAVNEATFLQRAERRTRASGVLIVAFSACVFACAAMLFLMPIEKRVLVEGSVSIRDGSVAFGVSSEIARHVERRGDVRVHAGAGPLGSLQNQRLSARVEAVDWSGGKPHLILDPSAKKFLQASNYHSESQLLIPQKKLRIIDILIGAKS